MPTASNPISPAILHARGLSGAAAGTYGSTRATPMLIGSLHVHRHRDPAGCRLPCRRGQAGGPGPRRATGPRIRRRVRGMASWPDPGRAQAIMLGISRLARVRVGDMVTHGKSATWAMRWEVACCCGTLVPALDAHIKLTAAGKDATLLTGADLPNRRSPGWPPDWTRRSCTRSPRQRSTPSPATSRQISPTRSPRLMQDKMLPAPVPEAEHRDRTAYRRRPVSRASCQLVRRTGLTLHRPQAPDGR